MARSETGTKAGKSGPKPRGMTASSPTKEPQDVDRHVGSRVRMQRMLVGMSQEKLGEACGITFQQIQKYEKGMNRMGASRLHQIARFLQVPVEFFYEGAPSGPGPRWWADKCRSEFLGDDRLLGHLRRPGTRQSLHGREGRQGPPPHHRYDEGSGVRGGVAAATQRNFFTLCAAT